MSPFVLLSSPGIHPTKLYELMAAALVTLTALFLIKQKIVDGLPFLVFALLFTGFRWFNSSLRVGAATLDIAPWFYPLLYLGIILLCGILIIIRLASWGQKSNSDGREGI